MKLFKRRPKPTEELGEDAMQIPATAESALPIRTNEIVVRSQTLVIVALSGALIVSFFRGNAAEDGIKPYPVFIEIRDESAKTYRIMDPAEIRVDAKEAFAEQLSQRFVEYWYEVLTNEPVMGFRWQPGGYIESYSSNFIYSQVKGKIDEAIAYAKKTGIERRVRNLRCEHIGVKAVGCYFLEANVDTLGREAETKNFAVRLTYDWLPQIPKQIRKINPTGWQVQSISGGATR